MMNIIKIEVKIEEEQLTVSQDFYERTKYLKTFTSDNLRETGLDQKLHNRNGIGGLFMTWVALGWAARLNQEHRSKFASTHGRRVGEWVWTAKGRHVLER